MTVKTKPLFLRKEWLCQNERKRLQELCTEEDQIWIDSSIGDVLPNPSPLIVDSFQKATDNTAGIAKAFRALGFNYDRKNLDRPLFEIICGHPYINLSEYLKAVSLDSWVRIRVKGQDLKITLRWVNPHTAFKQIYLFLRSFFRVRREFYTKFETSLSPPLLEESLKERNRDLSTLSLDELWSLFEEYAQRNSLEMTYFHLLTDIISGISQGLARVVLKWIYGSRAREMELELTTGLEKNFNTLTHLSLWEVANKKKTLEEFLEHFGHRGNPDWDLAAPRWRETPEKIQQMAEKIRSSNTDAPAQFELQKSRRMKAEADLQEKIEKGLLSHFFKHWLLNQIRYYQIYSPLREATQSICFLWVELSRRVVLEISKRTEADDLLFYLKMDELQKYCNANESEGEDTQRHLLTQAQQRKTDLQLLRSIYVPHIISRAHLSQIGAPPDLDPTIQVLKGEPVCHGYIQGRARVMKNLDEANGLEQGEILVAQFTDPAWTPLFLIAGGLVLEQGSSLSHGAIVAREYGLPAVVNVADVTRRIKTGQLITLDANSGKVYLT